MSEEQTTNITKKKNRKVLIIGLIAIAVVVILATVFIYASGSKDRKLKDTLQLAENYLNELDYEKAISAYEDAINIDPKCVDAYIGIADIYVAMADEAENSKDYETAIKDCDSGLETLNRALNQENDDSEAITVKITEINSKKEEIQKKLDDQLAEEQKKLEEEEKAKEEEEKKAKLLSNDSDLSSVQVGDTVYFGHRGYVNLSWDVLDVQEDKVLLLVNIGDFNIDIITNYEKYFYDEEQDKIIPTFIVDTKNNIPKKFDGKKTVSYEYFYPIKASGMGHMESKKRPGETPLYTYTTIGIYELLNSEIDGEEVNCFYLSYDEAKKYAVKNSKLRNVVYVKEDVYVNNITDESIEAEYKEGEYDYDSTYGYHDFSEEYEAEGVVDANGNLAFLDSNGYLAFSDEDTDEDLEESIKPRVAIWVSTK